MSLRKPFLYTFAIALGLLCATGVLAWTGPSLGFPGGNATAPLNVSSSGQIKSGVLTAGGLSAPVFCIGVSCISSWASAGGSQWTTSGSTIYYNGGNVGIGTASPTSQLYIQGGANNSGNTFTINNRTRFDSQLAVLVQAGTAAGDFAITTAGSVGIGTLTPDSILEVAQPSNWPRIAMLRSGLGTWYMGASDATNNFGISLNSSAQLLTVSTAGNVGIGTASPSGKLDAESGGAATWAGMFNYNAGSPAGPYGIWTSGTSYALYANGPVYGSAFYYSSDERLKKNIAAIASSSALQDVLALQPVTFNWIDTTRPTTTQIGFIAQQVQKVVPELVYTDASTTLEAVDYARVTPLLVGAVQQQQAQIDAQNRKIDDQQKEIDALEAEVAALKAGH
jgi:Chaperone of endosialidase